MLHMYSYILNFHGVGPVLRPMEEQEMNYWLEPEFVDAVLDIAKKNPDVEITVDDGNESDIRHVLPSLIRHGLTAKFFICSSRMDQPGFLSRAQVRELHDAGMGVGSHGVTHRSWRHLLPVELREELENSRRELERVCGQPVDEAACPYGSYDRKVLKALREAGYQRVYTSDGGVSESGSWLRSRITVTHQMSLDDVERMLADGPGILKQWSIHTKQLCKSLR